jgi:DNA-directed RNA polymerase specialized sigma24 family protein
MTVPPEVDHPPDLREGFEQVFDAHFAEIHRYVARRLPDAADDLAAEVFLEAYRGRYDPDKGAVRPWLYGIATHLVSRHRRTEVRRWKALSRLGERAEQSHEDATLDGAELTGHPSELLFEPLRPAVRAALLRVLAGLPGTKVSDEIVYGGTGHAQIQVVFVESLTSYTGDGLTPLEDRVLLDFDTGAVVGVVTVAARSGGGTPKGTTLRTRVMRPETGWTDQRPKRPGNCKRL